MMEEAENIFAEMKEWIDSGALSSRVHFCQTTNLSKSLVHILLHQMNNS